MDDLLPRFAARLSDLGVTAEVGAALPAGPGVQTTTVRLTRGTSTQAYRLLYGPTVSLADAGLATKLTLAQYRGESGPVKDVHSDDPVFVSGESAAEDLLRPATLTLYVEELDPRLPVVNKWRSDGPANIVVRRKFWQAPNDNDGALAGVRPTPWPLVYADLVTSDDPRVRTVARQWRDRFAGHDQRH